MDDMNPCCPIHQPVHVREYDRCRFGKIEHVCAHCRSMPNV